MSAADNLANNSGVVAYTSYFPSDKIAVYTTKESSSGIGTAARITPVVGTWDGIGGTNNIATLANPYGKKCQMTLSWSLDGLNFYPSQIRAYYFNSTFNTYLTQCTCFGSCSDSTITVVAYSEYTLGDQAVYVQFALDSPT